MQQEAGNNSQQLQIKDCNIHFGIDEKRAREISNEIFDARRKELSIEALTEAKKRIQNFEDELIKRMQKVENSFNAFSDPAFQFLLLEAQKTAAKTNRSVDYELLSELLINKTKTTNNSNIRVGISRAIEVVDDVSDDSLIALTVFIATLYNPITGNMAEGLDIIDNLFEKALYRNLPNPTENEWLDNLDIVGAIRLSSIGTLNKFEKMYLEKLPGYCVVGIKKDSDTYKKVLDMLNIVDLPSSILCDNILDENYVRLQITKEDDIDKLEWKFSTNIGIPPLASTIHKPLTKEQKETLHKIYSMYDNKSELINSFKEKFYKEMEKRESLNLIQEWWNKIPRAFDVTAIGKALAYANLKRLSPNIPEMK